MGKTNLRTDYGLPKTKSEIIYEIALTLCEGRESVTKEMILKAQESYDNFVKLGIISEDDEIDTFIKEAYPEDKNLINSKMLDVYEKKGIYTKTFLGTKNQ